MRAVSMDNAAPPETRNLMWPPNFLSTAEKTHLESHWQPMASTGVMLCRFHPLTDKVGVLVHKVYDALVIFGVLVVLAVALHHFEGSQVHLYGFNNLIANPCR